MWRWESACPSCASLSRRAVSERPPSLSPALAWAEHRMPRTTTYRTTHFTHPPTPRRCAVWRGLGRHGFPGDLSTANGGCLSDMCAANPCPMPAALPQRNDRGLRLGDLHSRTGVCSHYLRGSCLHRIHRTERVSKQHPLVFVGGAYSTAVPLERARSCFLLSYCLIKAPCDGPCCTRNPHFESGLLLACA
jgi:hypothetical protein